MPFDIATQSENSASIYSINMRFKKSEQAEKGELVIADSIPRKNLTVNVGLCLLIKCAGWAP